MMTMHSRSGRLVGLIGLLLLSLSLTGIAAAAPAPEGFDQYLVYMADGVFDPKDDTDAPGGEFFQREIMQRTEEEAAAELERAEQFFLERFGLDFTSVDAKDGVKTIEGVATLDTRGFMLNPNREYRAYTVSEETVPTEGWVVRDGG